MWFSSGSCGLIVVLYQVAGVLPARVTLIHYNEIMAVKSPCIDVCEFDSRTGYCLGCARTLEEARKWEKLTDYRRHAILNDRARREVKLGRQVGYRD
jgi:hypothetical protein